MANITVIGTGYVGLVSGACLADFGNFVVCVDIDKGKIEALQKGNIPIFEPGLDEVVKKNVLEGRLSFSGDLQKAIDQNEVVFIAVGTPSAEDGSADLSFVEGVARDIGRGMNGHKVVVDKSTVPIGTGQKVKEWIMEELETRGIDITFDVVSNPEFLREGSAVYDFMHPDRIVIGAESKIAVEIMEGIYRSLTINNAPFIKTNIETAEMIKYASNAFLAVKIGFINEIANLCEVVGADVLDVARAMGRDGRIGPKFLHPGPGYGGSCFPKDTRALAYIGRKAGCPLSIVNATIESNEQQKLRMVDKIESMLGNLRDKVIAVLGLSFKPNTNDVREASSIQIIKELATRGARLKVYDPIAMNEAKSQLKEHSGAISYCPNEYETIKDADALVVVTEWNQFRSLDLKKVKEILRGPFLFDLKNIYDKEVAVQLGFSYIAVGR